MGITDENIHVFTAQTTKEVNAMIRREVNKMNTLAFDGKRVFIFVYCAGHGVADQQ